MKKLKRPFIIDVEASGFGPDSYPIEVGLALESGMRYCRLISPCGHWTHWDRAAEQVHGISRQMLAQNGYPVCQIALDLNRILGQATVYSDGWSVDKPWMTRLFHEAGMVRSFSISPLERILSPEQMENWHQTQAQVLDRLNIQRHRASTDALLIQETWMATRELAEKGGKNGLNRV